MLISGSIVGIKFKGGVILAAEKRVTLGPTLRSHGGKKIFKVLDNLYIGVAGLAADMQAIARALRAEMKLYELRNKRLPTVKAAAKLLSNILYSSKLFPYYTSIITVGIDETGPHLYVLDPLGSVIEDKYASLGSGAELAISIIESNYRENLTAEEAEKIAYQSVKAACERDVLSGDGVDMVIMDVKGNVNEKFLPLK